MASTSTLGSSIPSPSSPGRSRDLLPVTSVMVATSSVVSRARYWAAASLSKLPVPQVPRRIATSSPAAVRLCLVSSARSGGPLPVPSPLAGEGQGGGEVLGRLLPHPDPP